MAVEKPSMDESAMATDQSGQNWMSNPNQTQPGDEKEKNIDVEVKSKEEGSVEENSDYPEVRSSVPPTDEDLPVNTVRAWTLGIISTIIICGLNQFFQLHNPPLSISAYVMILIFYPIGQLWAKLFPKKDLTVFGKTFSLNPGPFNRKEHTILAIMAVGTSSYDNGSVASDVWTAFVKLLNIPTSTGFKLLFLLTSQGLAFGLAGIFQRLVVDPAYCVWPAALPTCGLLHGLHNHSFQNFVVDKWKMSRMRFFWITLIVAALWQVVPGYLFTGLTTFAWITWIAPDNVAVNQVFGAQTGMDLLPMTLDWNQVTSYLGSPLVVPSWALMNVVFGSLLFLWVIGPALHWSNHWQGKYFPFSSSSIFDNTGASYNTTRVLTADYTLNESAYHQYSPIFLSTTSVLSYGLGLGAVTSILVHTFLHHREEIWRGLKATLKIGSTDAEMKEDDVHTKLMKAYKPTPTWWYLISFIIIIVLTIVFVEIEHTGLPVYGVILSIIINLITFVPVAIMAALCNQAISTNILAALIGGFLWPGKMVAVVIFKILTFNTLGTALVLARDQKLAHYMKIPPRTVFAAQATGVLVSWLSQTGVNIWALANIENICTGEALDNFICPIAQSYKSSVVFWGLIGPQKLFASGAMYNSMLYFFLVGALLPIVFYYASRRYPNSALKYIHIPVIMSSTAAIPPATASNYIPWGVVGLFFNSFVKRRFRGWWMKYNYMMSAALDAGLAITTFLLFFCLEYPGATLNWWGNSIADTTADGLGTPLLTVPEGTTIGPSTWR